ncbi:hypothetical protein MXB_5311 [Myxobolus squamalis]|nr:hypothetical protein MXB_5311 [Myxobolus squamalis]
MMKWLLKICYLVIVFHIYISTPASIDNAMMVEMGFEYVVEGAVGPANGDSVLLRWSRIKRPSTSDQIGLYCPRSLPDSKILRRYKHEQFSDIGESDGEIVVNVFYPRTSCEFRIRITWVSGSSLKPFVKYGKSFLNLNMMESGTSSTYTEDDMCEPPATTFGYIAPGFIHTVVIKNLEKDMTYFYKCANSKTESATFSFKSPKTSGISERNPVFLDVFGDLDITQGSGSYITILRIGNELTRQVPLDAILLVGDVSYAMGIAYTWEEFGKMIQKVASAVPFMMSIGNHEHDYINGSEKDPSNDGPNYRPNPETYESDSGGECSIPMLYRYQMPGNGNRLFWLRKNDLKSINRDATPIVIVLIHRSLYTSAIDSDLDPVSNLIRTALEPLLIYYQVDFIITGHYHFYERTCPLNDGICVQGVLTPENWGIVHLNVGTGGRPLNKPIKKSNKWTKFAAFKHGYGRLEIVSETQVKWKFKENNSGEVIDSEEYLINKKF